MYTDMLLVMNIDIFTPVSYICIYTYIYIYILKYTCLRIVLILVVAQNYVEKIRVQECQGKTVQRGYHMDMWVKPLVGLFGWWGYIQCVCKCNM